MNRWMVTGVLTVAVAALLGGTTDRVKAASVLVDGFETVPGSTDGTGDFDPSDNNNPHPHGPPTLGAIQEATPEGIQVRTQAVAPGPAEGIQYLKITEGDAYIPFLSPAIANSQAFTVTFWVHNSGVNGLNLQVGRINTENGPNIGFSNLRWEGGNIQRITGPTWITITSFTPGQWDRIGLEYDAPGTAATFNLYVNDFATPVATGLPVNNPFFSPALNNVFFGTRSGAGEIYIDGIDVFEGPMPEPTTVASTPVLVNDLFGLQFLTERSRTYSLESTADLLDAGGFQRTGFLLQGNGDLMTVFDPAGAADTKAYRVVIE